MGHHVGMATKAETALAKVRKACLAPPEFNERLSHGAPTFFIRDRKTFVMFVDDHHGDGRLALWVTAGPGVQAEMADEEPGAVLRPALRRPRTVMESTGRTTVVVLAPDSGVRGRRSGARNGVGWDPVTGAGEGRAGVPSKPSARPPAAIPVSSGPA